ncbi:MAG: TonB-dependent receptor, partial [Mangrovicoccus sp.]
TLFLPRVGCEYRAVNSGNTLLNQPLAETARTVNAITEQVIQDKNATSIRELARTTPGVTLGTGEGGNSFGDVLFIRGFKSSNDVFIDGQRNAGVAVGETFMAEQVEITKGPSGSIAGRGTTGGAVNLITKKAQDTDFLKSQTTVGTNDLARQTLDWNKVWNDKFKTRVNAMAQVAEVAGRDESQDDRLGLSFAAEYQATDQLTITADYFHLKFDQMPDWGVGWDSVNGVPFTEKASGRPTVDRDTFYGVPDRDFHEATQDVATIGFNYDFLNGLVFDNRTRYAEQVNDYILSAPERPDQSAADPDDWTLTASPKSVYQVTETLANTSTLTFDADLWGGKHTFVAGLDISKESISKSSYQGLTSEVGGGTAITNLAGCEVSIFDPNTDDCYDSSTDLVRSDPTKTEVLTKSIYLNDSFEVNERLSFNLGIRWDDYDIERKGVDGRSGEAYKYSRQDTMFNWNAGATFKVAPGGMIYAAYATSSNPMGQELDAGGGSYGGLDEAGEILNPEENTSLEIGTKWTFNDHLLLTAAAFRTTKDNARESVGRGPDAVTTDTGKYKVEGFEIGISGKVTDKLSVYGGATKMYSEILESATEDNIGLEFANIAHEQFNLLANYDVTDDLSIGGQATWRGKVNGGTFAANPETEIPSYWRFDLMADYHITDDASV